MSIASPRHQLVESVGERHHAEGGCGREAQGIGIELMRCGSKRGRAPSRRQRPGRGPGPGVHVGLVVPGRAYGSGAGIGGTESRGGRPRSGVLSSKTTSKPTNSEERTLCTPPAAPRRAAPPSRTLQDRGLVGRVGRVLHVTPGGGARAAGGRGARHAAVARMTRWQSRVPAVHA